MKTAFTAACGVLLFCLFVKIGHAQLYHQGAQFAGVSVGLNFTDTDIPVGVNYEYATKREVGIGGMFRYWSRTTMHYTDGGTYVWNTELIGIQANYHFKVPQRDIDPFLGAVVGYGFSQGSAHNTTLTFVGSVGAPPSFLFALQAGARYFLNDQIALVGKLAFGNYSYNVIEIGGDFSI